MSVKVCQKIVGMIGKIGSAMLRDCDSTSVKVLECPKQLEGMTFRQEGLNTVIAYQAAAAGRGKVTLEIEGKAYTIPSVVFKQKEFFLSLVLSSNFHYGFDPEHFIFGYDEDKRHVSGHAFEKVCKNIEGIYHKYRVPITWLIDSHVAQQGKDRLELWHQEYGDDYGVMPTSYFNHNKLNYNTEYSAEDTKQMLKDAVDGVEHVFNTYTHLVGIDQWVGSVGSHFVKAAEALGMKGIWGMGYDHFTCDTSMFHRGCPWDMYKPDRDNVKVPARYPADLWALQWTTRDIINTVHTPTGCSGSVVFSTDVDDIRQTNILQSQEDYYIRLLREYKKNMDHNDFFVYLVHQEDHDSHFKEDNTYLNTFISQAAGEATLATLEEILLWLNMKYAPEEHPAQVFYLEDVLTCQQQVEFGYGGVQRPEDWGQYEGKYGPHGAFYNRDMQVIVQRPYAKPFRVFDYAAQHPVREIDSYPEEEYGEVLIANQRFHDEQGELCFTSSIRVERDIPRFPLVVWDYPAEWKNKLESAAQNGQVCFFTDAYAVLVVPLHAGDNTVEL